MSGYLNEGIFMARAPLRIPIAGGGTDLPEYFSKFGGHWLSLSIDKSVCVVLHKNTLEQYFVHYKNNETCDMPEKIQHPIIKNMLLDFDVKEHLSIHSISELPGNSGLGSSSTFALCLAQCLSKISNRSIMNLPEYVYDFERNKLGEYVGKQDVWAAYSGGLKEYKVSTAGQVSVTNLLGSQQVLDFCDHLLLVQAGKQRLANEILKDQAQKLNTDKNFEEKYHKTKQIAEEISLILKEGDYYSYGKLVDKHWQNKMSTFNNKFDQEVFDVYDELKNANAVGAKLCGAGNSGFMLAVFESESEVNNFIRNSKRKCIKVRPDFMGMR